MNVHFIAIGGSVMHQLAIALKRKGYVVTGSDDEIFEPARTNLQQEGLLPAVMGWQPASIHANLDAVILGMHAKGDNPELQRATELALPIYSFPEYIFQESRDKKRVVVGGSHGKTTTTAMIMTVLRHAGFDFDYLVGARLEGFSQSVNITRAPLIVCEGDVFPTFDNYLEQFRIFLDKIEPGGLLIYNETDAVLKKLVEEHPSTVKRVGYSVPVHRIENGITLVELGGQTGALKVFGEHNLLNAHAAFLVALELGMDAGKFLEGMAGFMGAAKRLELMAAHPGVYVYRDFAHAPSKVKATMHAVKTQFPGRRLIAVLELHTYSSLNEQFLHEYKGALDLADEAVVFYSRHALELKRLPPLPEEKVRDEFGKPGLAVIQEKEELQHWLMERSYKNANLLLMSSGNYDGLDLNSLVDHITK
jgi:UDP-N-acetylmuramate: L-alanyl-gamma-D-glutamyl-meso-diaminopimelate ligase